MVLAKALASAHQVAIRNMSSQFRHYEGKALERDWRYFTWKGMKKNYAVLPLVLIMGGAVTGLCGFIAYSTRTRTDVSFNRSKPQISDSMDMLNPEVNKMRIVNQEYKPNPVLQAGLDAIKG